MKNICLVPLIMVLFLVAACDSQSVMSRGFSLPAGDVENGEVVFDDLQCSACHTLAGSDKEDLERSINVPLVAKPGRPYTYEFLVTSIINPSHKLAKGYPKDEVSFEGESKMRRYNDFMTVTELVDLVEFLKVELDVPQGPKTVYPGLSIPILRDPS